MKESSSTTRNALIFTFVTGSVAWLVAARWLGTLSGLIGILAWRTVAYISGPFRADNATVIVNGLAAALSGTIFTLIFIPTWRHFCEGASPARKRIYLITGAAAWLLLLGVGRLSI